MAKRIYRLSQLSRGAVADTVAARHARHGDKMNIELLERCQVLWANLHKARMERDRCFRYVYGDQWSDLIEYEGETMTEKQYISAKGNVPLVNNVIRRLVTSVVGQYVKAEMEPVVTARDRDEQKAGEMMTITLQTNWQRNKMRVLLTKMMEDYLVGGMVFESERYEDFGMGEKDVLSRVPEPDMMFFDSGMSDPRFWDMTLIGEIHDITFNELVSNFAKSPEDYRKLSEIYANEKLMSSRKDTEDPTKRHDTERMSFYSPVDSSLCRVFEVWTKETKARYRYHDPLNGEMGRVEIEDVGEIEQENMQRMKEAEEDGIPENEVPLIMYEFFIDSFWYYQFLTPDGTVLIEGETPFHHGSHPYSLSLYPFVNSEIHSFVSDFIDQQRYINRLITIDDFVRRTGAKGVTLVPEQLIPEDMSPEDFAEQWSSVDGLIVYTAKDGVPQPQQFYSHSVQLNTAELVSLQLQMMEDISNVHGALQGQGAPSGTSAALYAQQAQNSATGLAALFVRFGSFTEDIAKKKSKLMMQFYSEKRNVGIAGKSYSGIKQYDPAKARNMEFDYSVKESVTTPAFRSAQNEMLMQFWDKGAITLEMLLENGDFPFADSLLQSINAARENAGQNGMASPIDPAVMQQAMQGADPAAMGRAAQMIGGNYASPAR